MKKVLAILGIGCGVLLLVGVIAFAFFVRGCKRALGGAIASGKVMQEQEQQIAKLDAEFPFTPPAAGTLMALDEARLGDYLAVRRATMDAFKRHEAEIKAFDARMKDHKDKPSFGDIRDAANLGLGMMTETRKAWLAALAEHKMSPREYMAHTAAIYSTLVSQGLQQSHAAGDALDREIAETKVKLADPSLKPEERAALEAQLQSLEASRSGMAALPEGGDPATVAANATVIAGHKQEIQDLVNPGLDAMLSGKDAGDAFKQMGTFSSPSDK